MIEIGWLLFTKDGRKVSNSIVTGIKSSPEGVYIRFETDYGDKLIVPEKILPRLFFMDIDATAEIREWRENRLSNLFNIKNYRKRDEVPEGIKENSYKKKATQKNKRRS